MYIDLNDKKLENTFYKNGKECVLDRANNVLRILTPEEIVRQKVIRFLCENMEIPLLAIETEIQVSYFVAKARGRMDIVIYGLDGEAKIPIMVIECKAEDIPLTDEVFQQANKYAEIVDIPFIMLTNGLEAEIYYWNKEKSCYEQLLDFPKYNELCEPEKLTKYELEEYSYKRYGYEDLFVRKTVEEEIGKEFIGNDCKKDMIPYFLNLAECFLDNSVELSDITLNGYELQSDGGIRFTKFGNASGGSYPGLYRYVLVKDKDGNTQIISFSVMSCINGRTLLIVAVDDFDTHHNSLQLSLEHFSKLDHNHLQIFHDGTLTAGVKGKVRREDVLDYIKENSELNVKNNLIELGDLDCSKLLQINSDDVKVFVSNLIEYALVRDDFRKIYCRQ